MKEIIFREKKKWVNHYVIIVYTIVQITRPKVASISKAFGAMLNMDE